VARNEAIIIAPAIFRVLDWVNRLCRPLAEWLTTHLYRSMKAAFAAAASRTPGS